MSSLQLHRRSFLGHALGGALAAAWAAPLAAQAEPFAALHRLHTGDLGALVAVDATLGNRPWRCLLDSGASVALLSTARAAHEALRVIARSRVATAGGVMLLERVALPDVRIAGRGVHAPEALVMDLAALLSEVGAAIDGLIGAPSLRDQVVRLDLASGRLSWPREPTPSAGGPGRAIWPLQWDQGLPVVQLALGDREPAPFLLDTGNAGALVVFARHAQRLVADPQALPRVTMRELGGPVTVHQVLLERLTAPGWQLRDVPAVFESGSTARRGAHFDRLAGSAGLALFEGATLTLDGPAGRLVVEHPALPEPPPLPGGFGLALRSEPGAAPLVSAVFDGGPAARAGVRPGQRLLRLDGQDAGDRRVADLWQWLAGRERASFEFDAPGAATILARERFFARWR